MSSTVAASLTATTVATATHSHATALTESPYGYTPGLANTTAFLVVFSVLTLVHFLLAIKYKYYSAMFTMVTGGLLEILGWAGRLWSAKNVLAWNGFLMQICCLIIGPVFFSAWDYMLLGECIKRLGHQYSILGPAWYMIIFITADVVSLVLQAIGGGGAAVAAENYDDTTSSTRIMLAGILFQLATSVIFVALAGDFMLRVMWEKPYPKHWTFMRGLTLRKPKNADAEKDATTEVSVVDVDENAVPKDLTRSITGGRADPWLRRNQLLLIGVACATLMIFIRGIYRSIELAQGWDGVIITTEKYFIWLDGFPMVLCMAILAVAHPGFLLPPRRWRNAKA